MNEFNEPWAVQTEGGNEDYIADSRGCDRICSVYRGAINTERTRDRVIACVNFLAGIPTHVLHSDSDAVKMFLAYLKGDHFAAAAWADEVQARVTQKSGS